MLLLKSALLILVAFLHFAFMYLEMVVWRTPRGLKIFKLKQVEADHSAVLASNQGVYNGLLASGLLLSFALEPAAALVLQAYILGFICLVGLYGTMTVGRNILFLQTLPAAITLLALFLP